jgi:hypothetical protein
MVAAMCRSHHSWFFTKEQKFQLDAAKVDMNNICHHIAIQQLLISDYCTSTIFKFQSTQIIKMVRRNICLRSLTADLNRLVHIYKDHVFPQIVCS